MAATSTSLDKMGGALNKINKTVSLVLGSGGARGLAHIGAIHWLEENGYDIRSISGCSMGALIGGIYACDKLDVFEEWVRAISKLDIIRLLDVAWGKQGLVEGDRIITALRELVGDRRIEDLTIKYTAVAADIRREKEVWLKHGSLFDAIRASISLPLFFTPFEMNGMKLLDGGILNPVPIAPTFEDTTYLTIAINLGAPPSGKPQPVLKQLHPARVSSLPGEVSARRYSLPLNSAISGERCLEVIRCLLIWKSP